MRTTLTPGRRLSARSRKVLPLLTSRTRLACSPPATTQAALSSASASGCRCAPRAAARSATRRSTARRPTRRRRASTTGAPAARRQRAARRSRHGTGRLVGDARQGGELIADRGACRKRPPPGCRRRRQPAGSARVGAGRRPATDRGSQVADDDAVDVRAVAGERAGQRQRRRQVGCLDGGLTVFSASRSATWSLVLGASRRGTAPTAIRVMDWPGWRSSISRPTSDFACASRLGATSVACMEADTSSRTIASGPMARGLGT